jgi:predicted AAA+ superfamily ATPase
MTHRPTVTTKYRWNKLFPPGTIFTYFCYLLFNMRREEDFRAVIAQWVDFTLPELLSRDIEVPLDGDLIITIVGGRRTGKTYLFFQLIKHLLLNLDKRNVLYVNFEHERLRYLDARDLEDLLKVYYEMMLPDDKKPIFLFLDEIQNVSDWELWVRRVFDQRKFRLFLSGSSSKLLAKEIATSLRGRALSRIVTPFSFHEFLTAIWMNT